MDHQEVVMDHQVASYLQDVASLKTPVTADDRSRYLGSLDTL